MHKTTVFISVIDEEKKIAFALKNLLEKQFLERVDVFVAFDPRSLPPGKKWIDEITSALDRCAVEIIIASPTSVKAPWINFEAGCGWIRKIPVIPICHSGMTRDALPRPLADLHTPRATDDDGLMSIVSVVAASAECAVPTCDFSEFLNTIEEYQKTSQLLDGLLEGVFEQPPLAKTSGLAANEIATLLGIAEEDDALTSGTVVYQIKKRLSRGGFTGAAVNMAVRNLLSLGFLMRREETDYQGNEYTVFSITDFGWNWLNMNRDKFRLTTETPEEESPQSEFLPPAAPSSGDVPF